MNEKSPAKNLALLIHDVGRLMRKRIDQRAQKIGLTSAQWRVIAYLARHEGSNQASLADLMELEPITLSRHLDRMQRDGVIRREPDPADRRAHLLHLTDKGRDLVTAFRSEAGVVMEQATAGLGGNRLAEVIDVLTTMRANLTGKPETADRARPQPRARNKEGILS